MKTPKIIARYLPQFHHIKENDKWWGDGFTDWVSVKNGEPLFQGHQQPRVPLHGNYYDLLQKETMMWQAELATKYGIDGMAFYHYWFKDGRKILEKPAENLLEWKDIPMNFCFCWANETWARTWSKLNQIKNDWILESTEKPEDAQGDGILLDQKYGDRKDWIEHIEYLLPFFKDHRYLKLHGRPVFILYHPDLVYCLSEMLDCWISFLKEHGIPGIYMIGEFFGGTLREYPEMDAYLMRYPCGCREAKIRQEEKGSLFSYKIEWDHLLNHAIHDKANHPIYYCGFVDYDNSPRKGNAGDITVGASPEKFLHYLERILSIEKEKEHPFVFINAWNEWGESMYLEPDEENGYAMLEAVKRAKEACASENGQAEIAPLENPERDIHHESEEELRAHVARDENRFARSAQVRKILVDWLEIALRGGHVSDYLKRLGMKRIAVYGMGFFGQRFIEDLKTAEMELAYAIDQKKDAAIDGVPVYHPGDTLPPADAIVVTPYGRYDEIYAGMKGRVPCRMISLEHMISELL